MTTTLSVAALVITLALGTAGCGVDDDNAASLPEEEPSTETTVVDDEPEPLDEGEPDDEEPEEGSGDTDTEAACDAAERIAAFDAQTEAALGEIVGAADQAEAEVRLLELVDLAVESGPQVLDAYDDLAAAVPPELSADVGTVATFTEQIIATLEGVESSDQVITAFEALGAEGIAAGEATLRIDDFIQAECGFAFAS